MNCWAPLYPLQSTGYTQDSMTSSATSTITGSIRKAKKKSRTSRPKEWSSKEFSYSRPFRSPSPSSCSRRSRADGLSNDRRAIAHVRTQHRILGVFGYVRDAGRHGKVQAASKGR
ncbi:uncharacterized protein A4U43_C03F970 [Asparagus officinalis]|uniref:Uncharacterized protein n=1 Tax=Asparagus officinalis TaxID=4686 RepID=A0A5P1F854_ASPOF|nr:uncharacterized protein A4U43_C03F970 [Asparagus officinalis]